MSKGKNEDEPSLNSHGCGPPSKGARPLWADKFAGETKRETARKPQASVHQKEASIAESSQDVRAGARWVTATNRWLNKEPLTLLSKQTLLAFVASFSTPPLHSLPFCSPLFPPRQLITARPKWHSPLKMTPTIPLVLRKVIMRHKARTTLPPSSCNSINQKKAIGRKHFMPLSLRDSGFQGACFTCTQEGTPKLYR